MLAYTDGVLALDGVSLHDLAARHGTPVYVYSGATLRERYRRFEAAFAPLKPSVHYSVKANSNLSILELLRSEGAGFDIVSIGELHRVLAVSGDPRRIVFAGVGKRQDELDDAVRLGVRSFNAESFADLQRIDSAARKAGCTVQAAVRLNPDVEAGTHHYITTGTRRNKFGMDPDVASEAIRWARGRSALDLCGIHVHIGSQIRKVEPYLEAVEFVDRFARGLEGFHLRQLDLGGGFGIGDDREQGIDLDRLVSVLQGPLERMGVTLLLEPGRHLVAPCGYLVTRIIEQKASRGTNFLVVDAGMNDFIRPSLYEGRHRVMAVREGTTMRAGQVVGPICESSDFLTLEGEAIPSADEGELLALLDVGAYGFSMASQYNSRPRPAEVLVDGGVDRLIRRRECFDDLFAHELPYVTGPRP